MAGNGTPATDNSIFDIFSVQDHAPHFLVLTYLRLKDAFGDSYTKLRDGIIRIAEKEKNSASNKSQRGKLDIKLVTLIGVSDPTSKTGTAGVFLDTYFSKIDRKGFYSQQFPDYDKFTSRLAALVAKDKALGDDLRVRLSYTDVFAFIGLVGRENGKDKDLFHLSISIDPKYDVAGQHGNPTGQPLLQTIHLTDENPLHNIHYFYTFDLKPINKAANSLKIPNVKYVPQTTPLGTSARTGHQPGVIGKPQSTLGKKKPGGGKRTRRRRRTLRHL